MVALGVLVVWLVFGLAGAAATWRWANGLWKRRKDLSFGVAAVALISVTAAMLASLGVVIGLMRGLGAVGGESVDVSQKARALAEGISEAINCTALGIAIWLPTFTVLVLAKRTGANRPK
jgi:biopolymer transport protein ExbB/TolQ